MAKHKDDITGHLWVEQGELRQADVADVAPVVPIDRLYTFIIPDRLRGALAVGQRVRVPLGRRGRLVDGFVLEIDRRPWRSALREIDSVIDEESYLSPHLVELGRRIAAYYCAPLGQTLKAMTPQAVRLERGLTPVRYVSLAPRPPAEEGDAVRMSPKRRRVLEVLSHAGGPVRLETLVESAGASPAVVRGLEKAGLVHVEVRKELHDTVDFDLPAAEPDFALNDEQRQSLDTIAQKMDAGGFSATLLYGVSGSGKTEVYIHAMRRAVAAGRQAILLVPEIVLTTQLVQRLAARFTDVAVMHSGLTDVQRSIIWRKIASGEKKVVIGTRSAVFAPCPALGLICVDEEQEGSYKNLQAPRFHVRDVAIMRAHLLGIPIVLGSATPSLEMWHNSVTRPDYTRLTITRRVQAQPLPRVHVVDMREEMLVHGRGTIISRLLDMKLAETLARGEQAVILMNRRGFATRVFCPNCRTRIECPDCNVALVVHLAAGRALCHYCHRGVQIPTACPNPSCGAALIHHGAGTQRAEALLRQRFPDARIQRVDSDTMRHRSHYQKVIDDFAARRTDVLLGTQMIAKGLDFPAVSFVGVLDADMASAATDFRAAERAFQLITQVAGRAGRAGTPGEVVVQTTMPESPAVTCAVQHDYAAFAERELRARQRTMLPPFVRLARVVLMHERESSARDEGEALAGRAREVIRGRGLAGADVLGPNPCPLLRLRGRYRYDLLLRANEAGTLHTLLAELGGPGLRIKGGSVLIDVDPVAMA